MVKQFASILLAGLILVSSVGVSVNKHFCEKEGMLTSYFVDIDECVCDAPQKDHSCCHKTNEKPCHKEKNEDDGCCHHDSDYHQLDPDIAFELKDFELELDIQLAAVYFTLSAPEVSFNDHPSIVNYKAYKAPLPDRDIPVLVQSFLI